ncbi:hypothetical protein Ahy_A01g002557 [Arachis hypogaea]|uniref:Uncharacterized protein n=1 Tax=Arachis hypogaea TaxID=3818 RepID=A0A445ER48_ARAHY|nr:hypothetical protein Ahy_A01g002557 [Arachis hypogaea]
MAVFHLQFYNDDERCINSLREKVLLVDDLSCVEEDEEDLNPKVGLDCIADPGKLRVVESRVLGMIYNSSSMQLMNSTFHHNSPWKNTHVHRSKSKKILPMLAIWNKIASRKQWTGFKQPSVKR